MGADLDLAIVVNSRANLAGTQQAKLAIQGLADQTNNVIPFVQKHNVVEAEREVRQKVSAREVKQLTGALLTSIGASRGAGAAGSVAAAGIKALGNAAEFANLALAASGLAVVLIIPKLMEWAGSAGQVATANESLRESIAQQLDKFDEYLKYVTDADEAHKNLAKHVREVAFYQQIIERQKLSEEMKSQAAEVRGTVGWWHELRTVMFLTIHGYDAAIERAEKDKAVRMSGTAAIQEHAARIAILDDAIKRGVVAQEEDTRALDKGKKAAEAKKKAIDELRRAHEQYLRALHSQEAKEQKDAIKRETESANFVIRTREQLKRKREKQQREQDEADDAAARADHEREIQKRVDWGETVASGIGATQALFGKNKAAAIAGAIADTFVAANKAIAIYGPTPLGYANMAIAIVKGMANVTQIRKAGFDDPVNDAIAVSFGRRFANDVVGLIGAGFNSQMGQIARGGSSVTNINRGVTIQGGFHAGGFFATNETEFFKQFSRKLDTFNRRIGRQTALASST